MAKEDRRTSEADLENGVRLFLSRLEEIVESDPEVADIHAAFEAYCLKRYSLGNSATNQRVGGPRDLGIDFYSQRDRVYQIGQCKFPEREWIEANPGKVRSFGPQALSDATDALRYLFGKSDLKPNERVKQLYGLVEGDKSAPDFHVSFLVIVFGRLNARASDAFKALESEYATRRIKLSLAEIDSLVEELVVGADRAGEPIKFDLRIRKGELIRASNYCYFLANAADLYAAFMKFGWRLFDLNLRYEVQNSSINGEIVESLARSRSRRRFHHYNNGLIVVAKTYSLRDDETKVILAEAQIVNGLQTVKSIYNAVASKEVELGDLDSECVVQVKVIRTDEADFVSGLVKATNNQNPMAARNLRSNNREQKTLRTGFDALTPRWFYQVKEGEWKSLTSESARFFEQVVGRRPAEYRPEPTKQFARLIDNQDAAKAWLAFIGMADFAGDRVTHFFSDDAVYEIAFKSCPTIEYWKAFGESLDWDHGRAGMLGSSQGSASQYLLAYFVYQFVNRFIPSPQKYRELALNEGVKSGRIAKASGSFITTERDQDAFLAENRTYQTWRLMANMKELLAEIVTQVLVRRYGPLDGDVSSSLLRSFEAADFVVAGDIRESAQAAASAAELAKAQVFGRILRMLHHVSQQFWEEKKQALLSTSRLRTMLLKREIAASLKDLVWQTDERVGLDKAWKPEGVSFLRSLPALKKSGE
jgi:hypothetical protein